MSVALYLPFAGRHGLGGSFSVVGSHGSYWSSSPNSTTNARNLSFSSSNIASQGNDNRAVGFSVRCFKNY
jgi:hypothetical protein